MSKIKPNNQHSIPSTRRYRSRPPTKPAPEPAAVPEKAVPAELEMLDPNNMSELGKQLLKHRAEIVASGIPLLTLDEINQELAEARHSYLYDDE